MPTHFQGPPDEVRALDAFVKLMRAAQTVSSRLYARVAAEGLTQSQLGVLEALLHLGPLGQGELAGKMLISASNLTTVLDNLERRGLVRRERELQDRRCVTVCLTEAGRAEVERIFPGHASRVREVMEALSAEEQEELARLCRKLGRCAAGEGA